MAYGRLEWEIDGNWSKFRKAVADADEFAEKTLGKQRKVDIGADSAVKQARKAMADTERAQSDSLARRKRQVEDHAKAIGRDYSNSEDRYRREVDDSTKFFERQYKRRAEIRNKAIADQQIAEAALARRQLADNLRSSGTIASVIGGEKNINVDNYNQAQKATADAAKTSKKANDAVIADLKRYDVAAKQSAANTLSFYKSMQSSQALIGRGGEAAAKSVIRLRNEQVKMARESSWSWRTMANGIRGNNEQMSALLNTIKRFVIGYVVVKQLIQGFAFLQDALIGFNAFQETSLAGMTTLFKGNQKEARALYDDLKKFAVLSPFSMEQIFPKGLTLKAVGMSRQMVKDAMFAIGEQTAALGGDDQTFGIIAKALQDTFVKTRVSLEELNRQFAEAGVDATGLLANAYKVTKEQLLELISKGMIPGKEAAKALINQMLRAPELFGAMDRQARTFSGALRVISDQIKMLIASDSEKWFNKLRDAVVKFSRVIQNPEFIKRFSDFIEKVFTRAYDTISGFVYFVRDNWAVITVAIDAFIIRFIAMKALLTFNTFAQAIAGFMALSKAAKIATISIGLAAISAVAFVVAFQQFEEVRDITQSVGEFVIKTMGVIGEAFAWMVDRIGHAFDFLANVYKKIPQPSIADMAFNPALAAIGAMKKAMSEISNLGQYEDNQGFFKKYWADRLDDFRVGVAAAKRVAKDFGSGDILAMLGMPSADELLKLMNQEYDKVARKMPDLYTPALGKGKSKDGKSKVIGDLNDMAKGFSDYARAVEDSAKRQMDALRSIRDIMENFFMSAQKGLIELGITWNPLGDRIDKLRKAADLMGQIKQIEERANKDAGEARKLSDATRTNVELMQGRDGVLPNKGRGMLAPMSIPSIRAQNDLIEKYRKWGADKSKTTLNFEKDINDADIWGKTDKVIALSAEWGRAVENIAGYEKIFDAQTLAQSSNFVNIVLPKAKMSIKQLRDFAEEYQYLTNIKTATNASTERIRQYDLEVNAITAVTIAEKAHAEMLKRDDYKNLPPEMRIAEEATAIRNMTLQWNFESANKTLEEFNAAMADTELTADKVREIISKINLEIQQGMRAPGTGLTAEQISRLNNNAHTGDFNKKLQDMLGQAADFSDGVAKQAQTLHDSLVNSGVHDYYTDTNNQIEVMQQELDNLTKAATANGVAMDNYADVIARLKKLLDAAGKSVQQYSDDDTIGRWKKAYKDRMVLLTGPQYGFGAQEAQMRQELSNANWNSKQIDAVIPLSRVEYETKMMVDLTKQAMEDIHGIYQDAFERIYTDGPGSFFKNVIDGFTAMLNKISSQILANFIMKQTMGILSSFLGFTLPYAADAYMGSDALMNSGSNRILGEVPMNDPSPVINNGFMDGIRARNSSSSNSTVVNIGQVVTPDAKSFASKDLDRAISERTTAKNSAQFVAHGAASR